MTYSELSIVDYLAFKAGAKARASADLGKHLFLVVAPATSQIYKEVFNEDPGLLFTSLASALAYANDGSTSSFIPTTIYVAQGSYTSTTPTIISKEQSGLRVYFEKGSVLTTATPLGAGNGVLEIEAHEVEIVGSPKITNTQASQTGWAVVIGGTLSTEGFGTGAYIENLVVNGDLTTTDFVGNVLVRGVTDLVIKDSLLYASTGTTSEVISMIQATDGAGYTRDGARPRLINVQAIANTDSGNGVIPLSVGDASHPRGVIDGGVYVTDGSGKAIVLTSADWTLTGAGYAASTSTIGAGVPIDLVTATTINIGQFYVKDNNANTAATLFDQTNV
jgi:hypothetical protein